MGLIRSLHGNRREPNEYELHNGDSSGQLAEREEKKRLRKECQDHGILLSILRSETLRLGHTLRLLLDFKDHCHSATCSATSS